MRRGDHLKGDTFEVLIHDAGPEQMIAFGKVHRDGHRLPLLYLGDQHEDRVAVGARTEQNLKDLLGQALRRGGRRDLSFFVEQDRGAPPPSKLLELRAIIEALLAGGQR